VDGAVAISCTPASGFAFPMGTTTVNCSATDAHGNKAVGSFTVTVTVTNPPYGFIGVLDLPPPAGKKFNAGSAVPLQWRYTLNGTVINSVGADPQIQIVGPTGTPVGTFTPETPGNSNFQPPTVANGYTWQFNWQSTGLPPGTYQVYVGSVATGQTFPGLAFGPFTIILK